MAKFYIIEGLSAEAWTGIWCFGKCKGEHVIDDDDDLVSVDAKDGL